MKKLDIIYIKRKFDKKREIMIMQGKDLYKKIENYNCLIISNKEELMFYCDKSLKENENYKMVLEYEAIHFSFRPDFADIFDIIKVFSNLKLITMSRSNSKQVSNASLDLIELKNIKIESTNLRGIRKELNNTFLMEAYK